MNCASQSNVSRPRLASALAASLPDLVAARRAPVGRGVPIFAGDPGDQNVQTVAAAPFWRLDLHRISPNYLTV